MHEQKWRRRLEGRPLCLGCGQNIDTELCLDLSALQLRGQLCEHCISLHTRYTEDLSHA